MGQGKGKGRRGFI